mmetsp:Transcript_32227/g.74372  ORF Transcript_32227/g.74372 Transcript_32227/m.74372 type:complete len:243 (-) Transcript_32227:84-812(-)
MQTKLRRCLALGALFFGAKYFTNEAPTPAGGPDVSSAFVLASPPRFRGWQRSSAAPRAVLPEVSLAIADLEPTPSVVSSAFNVITFLPQYLWLLMVLAPNWSITRKVMEPLWPVLLFAAVHVFIVFNVASVNSDNLSDFTELAKVFDPRVSTNLFNDFSPQAAMMNLMKSPGFVSEEWSHVLAWDLFVGRWIYLDGQRRGIFTSHSVLFCNLIGPPGLLMHAITCLVLGKGLPKEEALEAAK